MTTDQVTLFLALLAVVAQVATVVLAVILVGARFSPALAGTRADLSETLGPQALGVAFAVATACTVGSLYLSEVANFTPCRLCWYQRIAMYPLVPLFGIAALKRDASVRIYAAVLAAVGGLIAIYHVLVERFPELESSDVCEAANPCTVIWVERFGYLTIPTMALSGFAFILVLLAFARPGAAHPGPDHDSERAGRTPTRTMQGAR